MHSMVEQLVNESDSMIKHALSQGIKIPADIADSLYILRIKCLEISNGEGVLEAEQVKKLAAIHQKLSSVIEPATPSTINLLYAEQQRQKLFSFLGPVALVRQMSFVAIFLLISMILVASSSDVNLTNINAGFFSSSGKTLLFNEAFLLCCAGLGASFSALFTANHYIAYGTYDPKYDSSYWSTLILGFMAGIIIVELLPSELFNSEESPLKNFGKPAFALLGGFSANMLYRLLKRLVDTVDHLIRGEPGAIKAAELKANQALVSEKHSQLKATQATDLLKLQSELENSKDLDECKKQINALIEKTISGPELQDN